MAKSISDIKSKLGITNSTTLSQLLTLAVQYEVVTQAEINNLKSISILPLSTNVKNAAEELKQRFTNIVLDENKGNLDIQNKRFVILTEIINHLNTIIAQIQVDITPDSTPTENSSKFVTSGGVYSALALLDSKKINYTDIIDNLTSADTDKPLSAKQGKTLKDLLDTEIANRRSGDQTNYGQYLNEAQARANADNTLQTNINNEATARTNADTNLQNQINTLKSVQNVVDTVATYSALQSYTTTNLDVNDKIQVIADENYSNATTIYNWTGSAWSYVGAYGGNSYTKDQTFTKTETIEQINSHKLISKTYSELVTLKANNQLIAGQRYRITDYVTKINGKCNGIDDTAKSLENPFDLIVTAISTNAFDEVASALHHSGDTYFTNAKLDKWKIWYSFENDYTRFEWADTTNGKGVIFRMIDEFQNDLPYDFKNIQFKRYKITATTDTRQANAIGKYLGFNGNYSCTSDSTDYKWYFTFTKRSSGTDNGSDLSLTQTLAEAYTNCYYVKQVKIKEFLTDTPNYRGLQALNNIVFECENIVVDVQIGVGSHHNTLIGNKDITYAYFNEMFRNNIIYGEMSHTRANECFENNMIGDFNSYGTYASCWNKYTHHFARNTAVHMESNDFEAQVSDCKLPTNFTRNHIFNMWGYVNASTHTSFNNCELGLMSVVTLSGSGTWDGVYSISLSNVTIKIANLFGSKLGRMEYVSISEGANNTYNIMNLTVGAIYGSSSKILSISLSDLASYQLISVYEKKIDFTFDSTNSKRRVLYTYSCYSSTNNIIDDIRYLGTISDDGTVTWAYINTIANKFYTKTESDSTFAPKSNAITHTGNQLQDYSGNNIYPNINADSIPDGAVSKPKLNNNVFTPDGIKMNGVTFVANQNRVSMVIYFEKTGTMEINVKGTLVDGLAQTVIRIGHSTSNTALNPTLSSADVITDGSFDKAYNVSFSDPYVCVLFEVAVSSYIYYDGLLNIVSPYITINNELMSSYSNIVFKNYTPSSYSYMVTGLPNIVSNEYVEEYAKNFYNVNTLPYLEKHNVINVSTAQGLVDAINSIATNADNNKATKLNIYDIYLASGTYELYDVIDKSDISEHTLYKRGLEIPDYVNLYGLGDVTISLTLPTTESDANVRALSTISVYGENHFTNIKFTTTNGRYCVHDDDGGKYKDRVISFTNCEFIHNGNTIGAWPQTYCIGAGYTGGRKGIYKNCVFDSTTIPFYMHTSSNYYMTDKCYLTLENCIFRTSDATKPSVDIQDPYGATNEGEIAINNCYLKTKLLVRGTVPFEIYGGGNNDFGVDNTTTTPSKVYIVGNSNSDFTN